MEAIRATRQTVTAKPDRHIPTEACACVRPANERDTIQEHPNLMTAAIDRYVQADDDGVVWATAVAGLDLCTLLKEVRG